MEWACTSPEGRMISMSPPTERTVSWPATSVAVIVPPTDSTQVSCRQPLDLHTALAIANLHAGTHRHIQPIVRALLFSGHERIENLRCELDLLGRPGGRKNVRLHFDPGGVCRAEGVDFGVIPAFHHDSPPQIGKADVGIQCGIERLFQLPRGCRPGQPQRNGQYQQKSPPGLA